MAKKILVIVGHPASDSSSARLAEEYAAGARQGGHTVEILWLNKLKFDPILRDGYQKVQTLENDLVEAQEKIKAANHIVWVFPIWWFNMPALLKGFLDRVFLPGYSFVYPQAGYRQTPLLTGRTATILVTAGGPDLYYRLFGLAATHAMASSLKYCGVRPVKRHIFGSFVNFPAKKMQRAIIKARKLGQLAG